MPYVSAASVGVPEMKSRAVSISGVNGLTFATAWTQPDSSASGT